MPSALEIKAKPKVSVPASVNFSDVFSAAIKSGFSGSGIQILDCTSAALPTKTFLIYFPLFEENLNVPSFGSDYLVGQQIPDIPANDLLEDSTGPIQLAALNDFLHGFEFRSIKSGLYISGSRITDIIKIELASNPAGFSKVINPIKGKPSYITPGQTEYERPELSPNGEEIDLDSLLNSAGDFQFDFKVSLIAGKTIESEMFASPRLKAELLVLFALDFEAGPDGAEIQFPDDMFAQDKDLFGRTTDDNAMLDMLRGMYLEIKLSSPAFNGGDLYIKDAGNPECTFLYPGALNGSYMIIDMQKRDLEIINRTIPFVPQIAVRFDSGGRITIPTDFKTSRLTFSADVNYRIDLRGNGQ